MKAERKAAGASHPRQGTGNGVGRRLAPPPLVAVHGFVVTETMKKRLDALREAGPFTSEAETLRHALNAGLNALRVAVA